MACKKVKTNITKAALEVLGQKKSIINKDKCPTKKTQWYCEDVKELAQDKREAYLEYRSKKKHQNLLIIKNKLRLKVK